MTSTPTSPSVEDGLERRLLQAGTMLLVILGGAALLGVLWAIEASPLPALGVTALAAAGLAGAFVPVSPLVRLATVLAMAAAVLGTEEGLQASEVVFGLIMVTYLGGWYAYHLLNGTRVVRSGLDVAMALWLTVGIGGGTALGLLFGPNPTEFRGELIGVIPFFFYFPAKEACARSRSGLVVVVLAFAWLGLYATFANAIALRSVVVAATQTWQVADARFTAGESYMGLGFLLTLALAVGSRALSIRVAALALGAALLAGLVLTRTRSFWISTAFGLCVMLLAQPSVARRRTAIYLFVGVATMVVLAATLFRDEALLLLAGTIGRFASLESAGQDISLLARFAEYRALWERIMDNPVLGYGWGVTYTHYTPLSLGTRTWSFTHNGWLSLWYKTGLWGLALMVYAWAAAAWEAARAAASPWLHPVDRAVGAAIVGSFAAYAVAANTANPFLAQDLVLSVTLLLAMASGLGQRRAAERPSPQGL